MPKVLTYDFLEMMVKHFLVSYLLECVGPVLNAANKSEYDVLVLVLVMVEVSVMEEPVVYSSLEESHRFKD